MSGNKVKIPIDDCAESNFKISVKDCGENEDNEIKVKIKEKDSHEDEYADNVFEKLSDIFDDTINGNIDSIINKKNTIKDESIQKIERASFRSKDFFEDVVYNSYSFYNWVKYVRNKDKGNEIFISKKD